LDSFELHVPAENGVRMRVRVKFKLKVRVGVRLGLKGEDEGKSSLP
jgi:hypothetical protein